MPFYAVARGKEIGVYKTWDECRIRVNGFSSARYKKFPSAKEAWEFIVEINGREGYVNQTPPLRARESKKRPHVNIRVSHEDEHSDDEYEEEKYRYGAPCEEPSRKRARVAIDRAVVYVDGACQHNGNWRGTACAGYGVHWPNGEAPNVQEMLAGEKQTNQRAELTASCCALEQAIGRDLISVEVRTDSMYTIKGATKWMEGWKKNGWQTLEKKAVLNRDLWERLDDLMKQVEVKWTHVRGHWGVAGNVKADRLAKQGAEKRRLQHRR